MATEHAHASKGRKISPVWFIPLLALVLGAYMVVHSMLTEGPEIEIAFKTASGLEKGKTKIKYRNVDMGLVEDVRLSDDLQGVIATAKLSRQTLPLLRDDTRFWVVTARVGAGGVSGLDTLLSGAYIQLAPGEGAEGTRSFVALEQPPLTPTGAPGLRIELTSVHASSISAGDPVLYKAYKVGRVESAEFDPVTRGMHYVLFIDAPYHELVNTATRFWDISGIRLNAGAEGFSVETGSLETILLGGVGFTTPPGVEDGDSVEHNTVFELHGSYEDILKNPFKYSAQFVVMFKQSIKGLAPGAPVEYRGIPVGRVERIMLKESTELQLKEGAQTTGRPIPVLITIEPARMALPDTQESLEFLKANIRRGVSEGLYATMESGNLLTGAKFIGVDYFETAAPGEIGEFLGHPVLPTIDAGIGQLMAKASSILDMINALPLNDTVAGANTAIASLDKSLQSLNTILESDDTRNLPAELEKTLQDLRDTLRGLSPGSEAYQSINSSLLRLNRTLGNLETVTGTLSNQPNAVLLGSDNAPDPVPEVSQ